MKDFNHTNRNKSFLQSKLQWLWRSAMVVVAVFLFSSNVQAQHPYGFMDGNVRNNDGKLDWENVWSNSGLPAGSISTGLVRDDQAGESIYTGGATKDHLDIPGWLNKLGTSSDKTNIQQAGAILIGEKIYFFGNRYSAEGATNIGFWFLQDEVSPITPAPGSSAGFNGEHMVGDILVVAEISQGGAVGKIAAYEWVGDGLGDVPSSNKTLRILIDPENPEDYPNNGELGAVVNATAQTTPWTHQAKGSVPANTMPAITFFEGFIDLAALDLSNTCFSSFIVETRASFSVTSILEDFAADGFNVRPSVTVASTGGCGSGSLTATVVGGIGNLTYEWSPAAGITAGQGTPTITVNASDTYTVVVTGEGIGGGECEDTDSEPVIVTPINTVDGPGSATACINTAITSITHNTTGATGIGSPTGLPNGVTAAWLNNVITISGTPTQAGTFNYSIPLTGGCGTVSALGSITVTPNNTVDGPGSATACINTAITSITHNTTGATGIGSPTGLPNGVTAAWLNNVITISGTPTQAGTFNYSIPLTGGCGTVSALGSITVTPNNTVDGPGSATACINTAITSITHNTTGATGIGSPTGLPNGVTAAWLNNVITISGTPTQAGTFNYSIPLTGGCGTVSALGSITVTPNNTVDGPGSATACINTAITSITHNTTGATGIGSPTGLPNGVTAAWLNNVITISGTPTQAGTFNYSIPLTGGCGTVSALGSITVTPNNTVDGPGSATACINTAITSITHNTTGATGIGSPTGLPNGVTAAWLNNVITISGTPTQAGTFNYSIPLTGGCGTVSALGSITVTPNNTVDGPGSATACINTAITSITHNTTGATGIGSPTGLPNGVTAAWLNNVITISGTPTQAGTFNYSIPLTGGCGTVSALGSITVQNCITPHLFPTATTCENYLCGNIESFQLRRLCVTLSKGNPNNRTITNAIPGAMFYYGDYTPTANGSVSIWVDQTAPNGYSGLDPQNLANVRVYSENCGSISYTAEIVGRDVKVTFNAEAGDKYVISVKYDPKSIIGSPAPTASTKYSFEMKLGASLNSATTISGSAGEIAIVTGCSDTTPPASGSCTSNLTAVSSNSLEGVRSDRISAYPTPFSDKATIEFSISKTENYVVNLYDMKGALVKQLKAGTAKAGELQLVEVDGTNLNEGLYIARMISDSGAKSVKLLLKRE
ncbi:T9SS type A sorting domain-containing protein [Pontibacter sp. H259]|uniref:T9SS type A sorting domain-containing protein n=1 Tax=Pontibacter sp. H259 TaxID=3133421 RepID=UPI0030BB834A